MTRRARRPFTVDQPLFQPPYEPLSASTASASARTSGEQAAASVSGLVSDPQSRRTKRDPLRDPLVGHFFHSFHPQSKYPDAPTLIVNWQGYVLGRLDDHSYLIELFSWFDGKPNGQQLQPIAGMADWKFYSTARDMKEWYREEYCPQVRDYSFEAAE
jgi:hypothetical protein